MLICRKTTQPNLIKIHYKYSHTECSPVIFQQCFTTSLGGCLRQVALHFIYTAERTLSTCISLQGNIVMINCNSSIFPIWPSALAVRFTDKHTTVNKPSNQLYGHSHGYNRKQGIHELKQCKIKSSQNTFLEFTLLHSL